MFSGNHQKVQVRTHNDVVDTKLDNVAKFDVLVDKDRLLYQNVGAGETIDIHRTSTPVSVKVIESECILPTEEKFDSSVHPLVLLDVLMTSLLSTSIDSSTGAMWRYDETLHVTPKSKDTPRSEKWIRTCSPNRLPAVRCMTAETNSQQIRTQWFILRDLKTDSAKNKLQLA